MQKHFETKLFGIALTADVSSSDYESMHVWYEFSVYSEIEGFVAYESVSATQFTGYYQRDRTITVGHDFITINQIKEFFSEAAADGSTAVAIQECLNQEMLQFPGYADLFIDELKSREIDFKLEKNEIA